MSINLFESSEFIMDHLTQESQFSNEQILDHLTVGISNSNGKFVQILDQIDDNNKKPIIMTPPFVWA